VCVRQQGGTGSVERATGRNSNLEMIDMYEYGTAMPTEYNGNKYRSRLEADVAAILDANKISFEYETKNFLLPSGHYLPDFIIGKHWAVEAKGVVTNEAILKCRELSEKGFMVAMITKSDVSLKKENKVPAQIFCKGQTWLTTLTFIGEKICWQPFDVYAAGGMNDDREWLANLKKLTPQISYLSPTLGSSRSGDCSEHSGGCMHCTVISQGRQIANSRAFLLYLNRDGLHGSIVECLEAFYNGKRIVFMVDKSCPTAKQNGDPQHGCIGISNSCGDCLSTSSYWYLIEYCRISHEQQILLLNNVENGKLSSEQIKEMFDFFGL
jgi:hypothetical protein